MHARDSARANSNETVKKKIKIRLKYTYVEQGSF